MTFRFECRTGGLRVASDVERLTGKRDGYRLIRKSASKLAVRQTIPVAYEVFRDCGAVEGGRYAIFPHPGKLHVRGVERIDAQSAQPVRGSSTGCGKIRRAHRQWVLRLWRI